MFPTRLWAAYSKEQVFSLIDFPLMPINRLSFNAQCRLSKQREGDLTQDLGTVPENWVSKNDPRKLECEYILSV